MAALTKTIAVFTLVFLFGGCGCNENIPLEGDFDTQVRQILHQIRLDPSEINNITRLYRDIQNTLHIIWPDVMLVPFGSFISGLSLKSSDVDYLIRFSVPRSSSAELAAQTYNQLLKQPDNFANIRVTTSTRIPRVTFRHIPTGRSCDLSFSGPSAVMNSQLVRYMMNLDQRALELALLVKYWCTVHDINTHTRDKLKSYAIAMQVVFFLQQKGLLPSVFELQKHVPSTLADGWNTAFARPSHDTNNNETVYQLLGGFFVYNSVFDFEKNMIAPFLGRLIERRAFVYLEDVPQEYALYKNNTMRGSAPLLLASPMCIQDPFDHNKNIARRVSPELMKKMIALYAFAAHTFRTANSNSFLPTILDRRYPSR